MNSTQLLQILSNARGYPLTREQENIIKHHNGPAWILAGPGTGKTEVLTVMLLRLLYVSDDPIQTVPIAPESIFVTTFTEKAARNLTDRLADMRSYVVAAEPSLSSTDISKLRIKTLHGLCNDLLQEFRAPNYQNVRLMDDFEQAMFIYEHMDVVKNSDNVRDIPFWSEFEFLFAKYPNVWKTNYGYCPRKWSMANALAKIFNRIAEDRIDIPKLRSQGNQMQRLADLYEEYNHKLETNYRCDFSHLQSRFLEFIKTPVGQAFLSGESGLGGLSWVLVDEYQDTNRIQEEIYMTLASQEKHNLMVVGDDDQAMYRFRGGSVECMVTFDIAVNTFLNFPVSSVKAYPLSTNFRSHPDIVQFCDNYITSFPIMNQKGSRVPNKPPLKPGSPISGSYPAVATLEAGRVKDLPIRFASTIKGLIDNGIVSDPNQCCLLLMSTKETKMNAGGYVQALRDMGLDVYNPRNKAFLEQEEVQCLLGALLSITDRDHSYVPRFHRGKNAGKLQYPLLQNCWEAFDDASSTNKELRDYVNSVTNRIQKAQLGKYFDSSLHEMSYLILGLEPFRTWQTDPVRRKRIGRITQLIEAYSSMPVPGYPDLSRGNIQISKDKTGQLVQGWVYQFYHLFFGYLDDAGLNDIEDEEVICPPGMVPIMTIHQSKGLEFPFVFVGHAGKTASPSDTHELEDMFNPYTMNSNRVFNIINANDRATLDLIRQYYVAYSRAQYALIIMGSKSQLGKKAIPCGPTKHWLRRNSVNI